MYGYFNIDKVGNSTITRANQQYLAKETGMNPFPIWHGQSRDWNELERIIDEEHEFIAIGGCCFISEKERKKLFDELFKRYPEENFHILGLSSKLLFSYPFFSVDSSAWLQGRKSGVLITPEGQVRPSADWTSKQNLVFNINLLKMLEDMYYGLQLNTDMFPSKNKKIRKKKTWGQLTFEPLSIDWTQ